MGEIFSLFGQIAIDYQDANKGLEQVSKQAGNTSDDLEGVDSAADSASDGLDSMGDTADSAGDDLDSLGDDADSAGGDIDDMGGDADSASGDLDDLGSSASSAAGDIDDAASSADDAAGSFDDLAGSADSASGSLSGMDVTSGSLAANGISSAVSSIGGFIKNCATAGDDIDKMSQKLGLSTKGYQEWDYVCKICGTDASGLKTGIKTLSNVITDAADGSDSANEKLAAVGLTLDDLNGKSQEEQLDMVIEALQGMEEGSERTAVATGLLGKSSQDLAPLFNMTAEETQNLKDKANDLGIVMSDEAVSASAEFNDAMTTLEATFQGAAGEIMAELMPQLTDLFDRITDCLPDIMGLIDGLMPLISVIFDILMDDLLPIIMDLIDVLVDDIMPIIEDIIDMLEPVLGPAIELIASLVTAAMKVIEPILKTLIDIISSIINWVLDFKENWDAAWTAIKDKVNTIVENIKTFFDNLKEKISSVFNSIKEKVSAVIESIKGFFDSMKEKISGVVDGIKTKITSVFTNIKTSVSNIVTGIKDSLVNGFNTAKEKVVSTITGIRDKFKSIFDGIKNTVKGVIDKIKGFFKFEVSLPKIKLPHFKIKPEGWSLGDLLKGSIPSLGIEWYAKAMDDGMVMTEPTIFGVNGNGQLMAGGEAGSETVVGTQSLLNMITEAVNVQNEALVAEVDDMFNSLFGRLDKYYPEMANTALVMDTGAVVGQLAPSMDTELGRIARRKSR